LFQRLAADEVVELVQREGRKCCKFAGDAGIKPEVSPLLFSEARS
jgi:hypothetical protein